MPRDVEALTPALDLRAATSRGSQRLAGRNAHVTDRDTHRHIRRSDEHMADASRTRAHMEVVRSDGQHVGTVDCVVGDREIKLTRRDEAAGGRHHYIPLGWVGEVGESVRLTKPTA